MIEIHSRAEYDMQFHDVFATLQVSTGMEKADTLRMR